MQKNLVCYYIHWARSIYYGSLYCAYIHICAYACRRVCMCQCVFVCMCQCVFVCMCQCVCVLACAVVNILICCAFIDMWWGLSVYECFHLLVASNRVPCPHGEPLVECIVSPCHFARCVNFPTAVCVDDHCGMCHARFFVGKIEVTSLCEAGV